ncbi:MAG: c-type cytochrome [Burkholderiaceae bacterium]
MNTRIVLPSSLARGICTLLLFPLALLAQPVCAEGDADRGQTLYESRCIACHSLDANRVGPLHRGVFGRRAGSVPGFDYSLALRNANVVWNDETLNAWLMGPEAFLPGQNMNYTVPEEKDRADLIAFLKRESRK